MSDRDDIVKMAKEAGIDLVDGEIYGSTNQAIFAFADLVRAAAIRERDEARAELADYIAWCEDAVRRCAQRRCADRDRLQRETEAERDDWKGKWDEAVKLCSENYLLSVNLRAQLDEARAELAKLKEFLRDVQECRDDWCEQYTHARDQRDALRRAIEAHNRMCETTPGARMDHPANYRIPLPAADAPELDLPGWSDPYDVTCARCGKTISTDEACAEEGNEWECFPCNERENERERRAATGQGEKP